MTKSDDDKPPVFATWRGWYGLVLAFLTVQILLFYWLTVVFE